MRIMIDTNVIISAVYNPKSKPARVLQHVCENHVLVLCDYIVEVTEKGTFVDQQQVSGANIFGKGFGDYDQDIILRFYTEEKK